MSTPKFYIGDRLPIIYDVAMAIHSLTPSGSKVGRRKIVHIYARALHTMWVKAFGPTHVATIKTVKSRIQSIMKDYDNKCYKVSCSKRRASDPSVKSLRMLNKRWRFQPGPVKKNTPKVKRKAHTNNDLFDIGKYMDKLTGDENSYYVDQCGQRAFRLSEKEDTEHAADIRREIERKDEE